MGTYSKPGQVLDDSLSKSVNVLNASMQSALKTVSDKKKADAQKAAKENAAALKLKKEQEKEKEKQIAETGKMQREFDKEYKEKTGNKFQTQKYKKGYWRVGFGAGDEDLIPQAEVPKYEQAIEDFKGVYENEDELKAAVEERDLDYNLFLKATDEGGLSLEDRGKNDLTDIYKSLSHVNGDDRNAVLERIQTAEAEFIETNALLNALTNKLRPGTANAPMDIEGQYKTVEKGMEGVPLYFLNDPDFEPFQNFARDYTLGINNQRYRSKFTDTGKYIIEYDYADKEGNIKTYEIDKDELVELTRQTGELVNITSKKKYDEFKKGLYEASGAKATKGESTYTSSTTTGADGQTLTLRERQVNYDKKKAKIEVFVEDFINTNGLYSEDSVINPQNNWQMAGGPDKNNPETWQYTGSPEQNDIVKERLTEDLIAQYIGENQTTIYRNSKEKIDTENELITEYKTGSAFDVNGEVAKYFKGATDLGGDNYSLNVANVKESWDKLTENGYEGAVKTLNYMGTMVSGSNVKYETGSNLAQGVKVVNNKGEKVSAVDKGIYMRVKNSAGEQVYVRKKALENPNNFLKKIGLYQGISRKTMDNTIKSYDKDLEDDTSMDNTAPALPIINQA